MKVTFKVNLGMVDAKRLGLEKKFAECKAGATVDVDKGAGEKLIEEGHATAAGEEDEVAASAQAMREEQPVVAGIAPRAGITAPAKTAPKATAEAEGEEAETSEVADLTVDEAVDKISRMRSKDHVQSILDTDQRKGVTEAAKKRLSDLG